MNTIPISVSVGGMIRAVYIQSSVHRDVVVFSRLLEDDNVLRCRPLLNLDCYNVSAEILAVAANPSASSDRESFFNSDKTSFSILQYIFWKSAFRNLGSFSFKLGMLLNVGSTQLGPRYNLTGTCSNSLRQLPYRSSSALYSWYPFVSLTTDIPSTAERATIEFYCSRFWLTG
jgi:hypothetical protein